MEKKCCNTRFYPIKVYRLEISNVIVSNFGHNIVIIQKDLVRRNPFIYCSCGLFIRYLQYKNQDQ
jgi:hypothetical protein